MNVFNLEDLKETLKFLYLEARDFLIDLYFRAIFSRKWSLNL